MVRDRFAFPGWTCAATKRFQRGGEREPAPHCLCRFLVRSVLPLPMGRAVEQAEEGVEEQKTAQHTSERLANAVLVCEVGELMEKDCLELLLRKKPEEALGHDERIRRFRHRRRVTWLDTHANRRKAETGSEARGEPIKGLSGPGSSAR